MSGWLRKTFRGKPQTVQTQQRQDDHPLIAGRRADVLNRADRLFGFGSQSGKAPGQELPQHVGFGQGKNPNIDLSKVMTDYNFDADGTPTGTAFRGTTTGALEQDSLQNLISAARLGQAHYEGLLGGRNLSYENQYGETMLPPQLQRAIESAAQEQQSAFIDQALPALLQSQAQGTYKSSRSPYATEVATQGYRDNLNDIIAQLTYADYVRERQAQDAAAEQLFRLHAAEQLVHENLREDEIADTPFNREFQRIALYNDLLNANPLGLQSGSNAAAAGGNVGLQAVGAIGNAVRRIPGISQGLSNIFNRQPQYHVGGRTTNLEQGGT